MSETHRGSCLCGAVQFESSGPLRGVVFCHCSQCRKQTGLYYAATDVEDAALTIEGAEALRWYAASDTSKRGFCGNCGSALFWKRNGSQKTSIMAGAFDQPSTLAPVGHIFMADKGDFYSVDDGLPQHPQADAAPVSHS